MAAADRREHDVVLFGATGFTGGLTAEYLAAHAPPGTRWAIAGRNPEKLARVRERIGAEGVAVVTADVDDPASVRSLAEAARVVITTVGPYIRHGEPLVGACAEAGTGYVDLTGEPEFVDRTYVRHHARAVETGARLVHCCGFDSIPHDLGALHCVKQLPEGVALKVEGFVRAGGMPSGGTLDSALTGFSRARQNVSAARERKALEQRPSGRRVRGVRAAPHREPAVDAWAVPLPTIDPQIVLRSARALERYGPDFSYGHYAAVKRLPMVAAGVAGIAGVFLAAQVPPARRLLLARVKPGEGPSEQQRAKSWFAVRFVGEGGGKRVVTEVRGGDPGYTETAKMLAESALCLALDDLPETAGQVTTAQAMGDALTGRLQRAGIEFEVLSSQG